MIVLIVMITLEIAGIEPDPITAIEIAGIITITVIVNSDVSI